MAQDDIKKGGISVQTEHIFPIIKKWLYSEKDIFLREIVSNAADAITKLKRLSSLGEIELPDNEEFKIRVILDKENKTLTVEDNGIGMSREEVERYICQMALSGALDFIQKYEGENDSGAQSGIIGHFGLGFYSSFMVSDTVEIFTKSYTGAPAAHWSCNEDGEYEIESAEIDARGTTIVMHVTDEEAEYLESSKIRSILHKYCSFMPIEIFFDDGSPVEADDEDEENKDDGAEKKPAEPKPINDVHPLWQKAASDCTPEEYTEFYRKVFTDYKEPLFYIHINADYPLNFKGILYFPKLVPEYETIDGEVKLYYNQVFVADNIKEIMPDYFIMLRGVLDCPELPLNVSRSYLQNNTYVSKVSAHIVKKVADKLTSMFKNEREQYEKIWDDLKLFLEFACLRDRKFFDRVKDSLLLKLTDNTFTDLASYLESAKETNEKTVYYTTDPATQAQYIRLFEAQGIKIAVFDKSLDTQFMSLLESVNEGVKFVRVDAEVAGALKSDVTAESSDDKALTDLFIKISGNEKLKVEYQALKDASVPAVLMISEESRRMEEMMKMYASNGMAFGADSFPTESTLLINTASPIKAKLCDLLTSDNERAELIAGQIFRLATLSQRKLNADEMQSFLSDSFKVLELL